MMNSVLAFCSRLWVQIAVALVISFLLALKFPEWPSNRIDTWHYFMSSVFQGLSALVGIILIVAVFFYERLELRLEKAKSDCEAAAHELSSTFPGYFDEDTYVELLERTRGIMKTYEMVIDHAESHINEGKTGGPSGQELTKAREEWSFWGNKRYPKAISYYEIWKRLELKQTTLSRLIRNYFVPMFIPIILSIILLCFTGVYTEKKELLASSMYVVLSLTILMILRLVFGIIMGAWNELMAISTSSVDPETALKRISELQITTKTMSSMSKKNPDK